METKKSSVSGKKIGLQTAAQKKSGTVKPKLEANRKRRNRVNLMKEVPISNLAEVLSWQL